MFVIEENPKSIAAESYKTLRTNVKYSSYGESFKSLLITSANPQEGKSTTAGNLALSFVQDGKKVILIDCDLRKPSIHKKFMISNEIGVSETILEISKISEVTQRHSSGLDIITSGKIPPNPSEMLDSENMKKLLEKLKEQYDCIIIDAPPILAVTDAQILARQTEGVIFVIQSGITKKKQIIRARNLLDKVKANIIGTVLNNVDMRTAREEYYYYYSAETAKRFKRPKLFRKNKV